MERLSEPKSITKSVPSRSKIGTDATPNTVWVALRSASGANGSYSTRVPPPVAASHLSSTPPSVGPTGDASTATRRPAALTAAANVLIASSQSIGASCPDASRASAPW